ncbi:MAG: Crp/Fnr family transcriptional regulator [Verrucomicrobiota bacterium]
MDQQELIDLLNLHEAFAAAPDEAVTDLIQSGEICEFVEGETLLHQGASGESIWVLLSGVLEVLVNDQKVKEITAQGEVVGEISAVSLTAATATVKTASAVSVFQIPHDELHRIMNSSPQLAAAMLRSMAKYLGR